MTQQQENTEAVNSLISRALETDNRRVADFLIESAHRLDQSIDVSEYQKVVRNNWQTREYNKRMELSK